MASRLVAAASSSSSSPLARLISSRRLSSAADHHGPVRVNIWQDPMSPSKWKEEHFVLASLAMWVGIGYGVSRLFTGTKEPKTQAAPSPAQ